MSLSPELGAHDVEADEAEARALTHCRDRGNRCVVNLPQQKAACICRVKGVGIVPSRVPAFGRRLLDGVVDIGSHHRADVEDVRGHGRHVNRVEQPGREPC